MGFPLRTLDPLNEPSNVRTFVYSLTHTHNAIPSFPLAQRAASSCIWENCGGGGGCVCMWVCGCMGGWYMLGEECGCECVNVGRGVRMERVYCTSMCESMHLKERESVGVVAQRLQ